MNTPTEEALALGRTAKSRGIVIPARDPLLLALLRTTNYTGLHACNPLLVAWMTGREETLARRAA